MNDRIWLEFEQKLHAYVRRRVSISSVDDVVSRVLLQLVRSQERMEGAKNPIAWVYRVAANVITDHYRKQASEKRILESYMQEPLIEEGSEEMTNGSNSLARCLIPLINDLPAPYGQAMMLTDINGISQSAAAKQMGLSVSGMKSRIQRGRQKLKAKLLRCCEIEENHRGNIMDYRIRSASAKCCST